MQQSRLNPEEKEEHTGDNPALSNVIERNIRTIIQLRLKAARERSLQDRIADAITSFSGAWSLFMCISGGLAFGFCLTPDV